jgi:hypothetical protein
MAGFIPAMLDWLLPSLISWPWSTRESVGMALLSFGIGIPAAAHAYEEIMGHQRDSLHHLQVMLGRDEVSHAPWVTSPKTPPWSAQSER